MSAPEPRAVNVGALYEALPATPTEPISAVTQGAGNDVGVVVTVIADVAVLPPSCVVTVIVALPAATPVTRPLLLTVATEELLVDHVTVLFVALEGDTVAVNCCVEP